jgi:hypothetical protein
MQRRIAALIAVGLLVGATAVQVCSKQPDLEVVYNRRGNALVLFGGNKSRKPDLASFRGTQTSQLEYAVFSMGDYDAEPYGNAFVRTEFESDVVYNGGVFKVWREVDGESETFWAGTSPQYNSSKIQLEESWRFSGVAVSVSVPGGVGFSGGGSTIRWSGSDTSGNHWWMGHTYSGLYAESYIFMSYVTQSSFGSHYFESTSWWVSTMASDH